MKNFLTRVPAQKYIIGLIGVFALASFGYAAYQYYGLTLYKLTLQQELTTLYENRVYSLYKKLADTRTERENLKGHLLNQQKIVGTLTNQVQDFGSAFQTFEKLSKIDPELLKKYSKVYFLNENYIPPPLAVIDPAHTFKRKEELILQRVAPFLQSLLNDATQASVDIEVISAYRSFGKQADLKYSYKITYGSGANAFSADQGYSEHQLGTTVDFTTSKLGASFTSFDKTPTYSWLLAHAHRYGFILSYPQNNTYYKFEPWHWRFVGRKLAEKLYQDDKHFYDLSQQDIDAYLLYFFD